MNKQAGEAVQFSKEPLTIGKEYAHFGDRGYSLVTLKSIEGLTAQNNFVVVEFNGGDKLVSWLDLHELSEV